MQLVKGKPFSAVGGGIAEDSSSPTGGRKGNRGKLSCRGGGSLCLQEADLSFSRTNLWAESEGDGHDGGDKLGRRCTDSGFPIRRGWSEAQGAVPAAKKLHRSWAGILGFSFTWRWGMESSSATTLGLCQQHLSGCAGALSGAAAGLRGQLNASRFRAGSGFTSAVVTLSFWLDLKLL